jgi:putative membrane protein insertion efficiency factor
MAFRFALACMIFILSIFFLLGSTHSVYGLSTAMKGPEKEMHNPRLDLDIETSSIKIIFLGAIKFYQKTISRSGGTDRCGFYPSCSAYGSSAIKGQGPVIGIMMTADRLTRCNIWKKPGADYTLLPNNKLYDPVSKNLLFE